MEAAGAVAVFILGLCFCAGGSTKELEPCSKHCEPCFNLGSCENSGSDFKCTCRTGFTGDRCEIDIDDCKPNPCKNGGICSDRPNYYYCSCPRGFTGDNCENEVDECALYCQPCLNSGECVDLVNGYSCKCAKGFSGKFCELENDGKVCLPNPCQHGGKCEEEGEGYRCKCVLGYEGDNCQTEINHCSPNPCKNGGKCKGDVNGYSCSCSKGFTGENCQTKQQKKCPSGWVTRGSYCYFFVHENNYPERRHWYGAHLECRRKGANLVSVHSRDEERFIFKYMRRTRYTRYWIGFHDRQREGDWMWSDGSKVNFKNWLPRVPDNAGNEDCAHIDPGFYGDFWSDVRCLNIYGYVCKKLL